MADLQIVPFAANAGNLANLGVFGAQSGDRVDLAIGVEAHTETYSAFTAVRLLPEADCVIRIGVGATAAAATGDPLKSGIEAERFVRQGERISVIAP